MSEIVLASILQKLIRKIVQEVGKKFRFLHAPANNNGSKGQQHLFFLQQIFQTNFVKQEKSRNVFLFFSSIISFVHKLVLKFFVRKFFLCVEEGSSNNLDNTTSILYAKSSSKWKFASSNPLNFHIHLYNSSLTLQSTFISPFCLNLEPLTFSINVNVA